MIPRGLANPALWAIVAVLTTAAAGFTWVIDAYGLHLRKLPIEAPGGRKVAAIPTESRSWVRIGTDRIEPPEVVEELGTSNYLTRYYAPREVVEAQTNTGDRPQVEPLEVHIAYYTGQIDTVPHVPERCFVGGGLSIGGASRVVRIPLTGRDWVDVADLPEGMARVVTTRLSNQYSDLPGARVRLPADPENLEMLVTEFIAPNGEPFFAGYFFIANGATVPRADEVRALAFDLRDDYAFYCKVQFQSTHVETAEELAELAASFLDEYYGEIARTIPDWIEVVRGNYPPPEAG